MSKNTKVKKEKRSVGRPRIHPIREKGPVGRPRKEPIIKEPRPIGKQIEMLIACKMTPVSIARAIGCSEEELRTKYADELLHGAERFQADLIQIIWETANRGNVQAVGMLGDIIARAARNGRQCHPALKLGKKAQAQADAERIMQPDTWLGPSSPPKLVIDNDEMK